MSYFYKSNGIAQSTLRIINALTLLTVLFLGIGLYTQSKFIPNLEIAEYRFWLTLLFVPLGIRTALFFLFSLVISLDSEKIRVESLWDTQDFFLEDDLKSISYRRFKSGLKQKTGVKIHLFLMNGSQEVFVLHRGENFAYLLQKSAFADKVKN